MFLCHRGISDYYPENTLGSIIEAIKHPDYIGAEIDIQLTRDEEWIVYHDNNLLRLNSIDKKVSDVIKSQSDWNNFFEEQNKIYYNLVKTAKESGVKLISDWGFRDDIPYGGWRKDQKAWMVNKDYSRKGAYYAVLKALYDAEQTKK